MSNRFFDGERHTGEGSRDLSASIAAALLRARSAVTAVKALRAGIVLRDAGEGEATILGRASPAGGDTAATSAALEKFMP